MRSAGVSIEAAGETLTSGTRRRLGAEAFLRAVPAALRRARAHCASRSDLRRRRGRSQRSSARCWRTASRRADGRSLAARAADRQGRRDESARGACVAASPGGDRRRAARSIPLACSSRSDEHGADKPRSSPRRSADRAEAAARRAGPARPRLRSAAQAAAAVAAHAARCSPSRREIGAPGGAGRRPALGALDFRRSHRQDAARCCRAATPPGCSTSSTAGIDHVLIDEAQDTNPAQWEILRRITADFTAGAGARGERVAHRSSRSATPSSRSTASRAPTPQQFEREPPLRTGAQGRGGRARLRGRQPDASFRSATAVLVGGRCHLRGRARISRGCRSTDAAVGTVHESARAAACRAASSSGRSSRREPTSRARRLDAAGRRAGEPRRRPCVAGRIADVRQALDARAATRPAGSGRPATC